MISLFILFLYNYIFDKSPKEKKALKMIIKASKLIYSHYALLIERAKEDVLLFDEKEFDEHQLRVPRVNDQLMEDLCKETIEHLSSLDSIPIVQSTDAMIIGDIHGNLRDLLRLLNIAQQHNHVIFLGDYVNRGAFSLECSILLFTLVVLFPHKFTLLRGNHEFKVVNTNAKDLNMSDRNCDLINEVFAYLPICCILDTNVKRYFCVHGGITNEIKTLDQIKTIPRPLMTYDDCKIAYQMVWADPGDVIGGVLETTRGVAAFGKNEVFTFLDENKLDRLLRGHEFVPNGTSSIFKGRVTTVFSSSNYNRAQNIAAYLIITEEGTFKKQLCFMKQLCRNNVFFNDIRPSVNQLSDSLAVKLKSPIRSTVSNTNVSKYQKVGHFMVPRMHSRKVLLKPQTFV